MPDFAHPTTPRSLVQLAQRREPAAHQEHDGRELGAKGATVLPDRRKPVHPGCAGSTQSRRAGVDGGQKLAADLGP